jgi:hypothetical protein
MAQPVASSAARQKNLDGTMSLRLLIATVVLCAAVVPAEETSAQEIDFGKIDKFESLASGTLHVGAPPKTIVDDGERHVVRKSIGDHRTEMLRALPSFPDGVSKHSKPWESSNWRPSVSPIVRSNTDMRCWVFGNKAKGRKLTPSVTRTPNLRRWLARQDYWVRANK